jgi:lambda family phage portal protein
MNWLDRAVGWFDPIQGARRGSARMAMQIQGRAYDAAKRDHRTQNWTATGCSANAEVGSAEEIVRNRSRDLVRNNGYALQIVETFADHVVGTGIVTAPTGLRGRNAKAVKERWSTWTENCDFDGDQDLNGLLWSAAKGWAESGSSLIRFRRQQFDGSTNIVPLRLQILEPDFIDLAKNGSLAGGGWIDRGIEYDALGRRTAFWLLPRHPGDVASWRSWSMTSERVPAEEIAYIFDKLRPGQDRGMPLLAPSIMTLQDLRSYFAAELVRKRIAACQVGVIETGDDSFYLGVQDEKAKAKIGPQAQKFEPGMFTRLLPGEKMTFNTPPNDSGIDAMASQYLREAAAGAGIMFEQVTGDFRGMNYSTWRAGNHGFKRRTERRQWNVMIHKGCRPIAARFTEAAIAAQMLPAIPGWRHTPPGFISVDPYKDAQADLLNLRMGKVSLPQLVEERGYDYVEFLGEVAEGLRQADEAMKKLGDGIMFDGDPRKVLKGAKPDKADKNGQVDEAADDTDDAATAA